MNYPIQKIRSDFPILSKKINGYPLTYLDNAASTQKPESVIVRESNYYRNEYSSVHRGTYTLSKIATDRIEKIREKVANFIHASSSEEIIFTKSATESINLVVNSFGRTFLQSGDNIVITEMEHHANIVPWQILSIEKKISIRYIPLLPDGNLDLSKLPFIIDKRTKIVSIIHLSNVLGILNPIRSIIYKIRKINNLIVLVDGSQSIAHCKIDVQSLDCDFYVFSGHKLYAPSGIGILYGRKSILDTMPPWEGGGSMIRSVSLKTGTVFNDVPWRFEAGSMNTAGIIGLESAIDYIKEIGYENIISHENNLMKYIHTILQKIPGIFFYGSNTNRVGVISFNIKKIHCYDIAQIIDQYGVAIRTGHQCAMPLMDYFKVSGMCRVSIAMYTNFEDIDRLTNGLIKVQHFFEKINTIKNHDK